MQIRETHPILTTYASSIVHIIPNNGIYNHMVKEQQLSISKYNIHILKSQNVYLRSNNKHLN